MPRRHAVLALVVAVCWAVNFVVIDIGLESFPPLLFAALRFGLIAVPAIFFVPRPDVRWPVVVAVGLFICVGQFGLLFVAMNTGLPAGLASVIAPLQPVFTIPLAAVALGERPSRRQVVGVTLAVAGIGAIAAGRAHGVPLQAVALGVASAAAWGCGNVVTRAARPKRPFSLLVWSSVVAPVPLLGLSLIFEGTAHWQSAASSINASGIAALAYVVVVSTSSGTAPGTGCCPATQPRQLRASPCSCRSSESSPRGSYAASTRPGASCSGLSSSWSALRSR